MENKLSVILSQSVSRSLNIYHKSQMFNLYKMSKWKSYSVTDKLALIASVRHGEWEANVFKPNIVALFWVVKFRSYAVIFVLIILAILLHPKAGHIAFNITMESVRWRLMVKQDQQTLLLLTISSNLRNT